MNNLQLVSAHLVLEEKIYQYANKLFEEIYGEPGDYDSFRIDDRFEGGLPCGYTITATFGDGLDYVTFDYEDLP